MPKIANRRNTHVLLIVGLMAEEGGGGGEGGEKARVRSAPFGSDNNWCMFWDNGRICFRKNQNNLNL